MLENEINSHKMSDLRGNLFNFSTILFLNSTKFCFNSDSRKPRSVNELINFSISSNL